MPQRGAGGAEGAETGAETGRGEWASQLSG